LWYSVEEGEEGEEGQIAEQMCDACWVPTSRVTRGQSTDLDSRSVPVGRSAVGGSGPRRVTAGGGGVELGSPRQAGRGLSTGQVGRQVRSAWLLRRAAGGMYILDRMHILGRGSGSAFKGSYVSMVCRWGWHIGDRACGGMACR